MQKTEILSLIAIIATIAGVVAGAFVIGEQNIDTVYTSQVTVTRKWQGDNNYFVNSTHGIYQMQNSEIYNQLQVNRTYLCNICLNRTTDNWAITGIC